MVLMKSAVRYVSMLNTYANVIFEKYFDEISISFRSEKQLFEVLT